MLKWLNAVMRLKAAELENEQLKRELKLLQDRLRVTQTDLYFANITIANYKQKEYDRVGGNARVGNVYVEEDWI